MRRLAVILIVAATVGSGALFASGAQEGAAGVTTIEAMLLGETNDQEMLKAIIAAYEEQSASVDVEYLPSPAGGWTKIQAMLAGGTAPDVFRVDDDAVYDFATGGNIISIDSYIDEKIDDPSKWYPATWDIVKVKGSLYALPFAFSTNVLHYNMDLLDEAGVNMPTSWENALEWDEFRLRMGKLSVGDQWGLGAEDGYLTALLYSNGVDQPIPFDVDGDIYVNDPKIVAMFEDYQDFILEDEYAAPVDQITDPNTRRVAFENDKIAAMWDVGSFGNWAENAGKNWDVGPTPKTKVDAMSASYFRVMAIPETSDKKDAAADFLFFFLSEAAQELVVEYNYGVPALKSVALNKFAAREVPEHVQIYANALSYEAPHPKNPLGAVWKHQLIDMGTNYMAGQISAQQYLDAMQKDIERRQKDISGN